MQLALRGSGLLEAGRATAWTREQRAKLRVAVAAGFEEAGPRVRDSVRRNVSGSLNIHRRGFLNTYRSKIYKTKPDRMPSMAIGSKVHFTGIQEHGGTVAPRGGLLLIPMTSPRSGSLINGRIGPKRFRQIVQRLMASGNAYFRKVNGTLILFAENIAENGGALSRFKRAERRRTGAKKLARGTEIPIAVAVPAVRLRKRTDVLGTVKRSLPDIVRAVESQIARSHGR